MNVEGTVKCTEIGSIPAGWAVTKLGDAVEINRASRDPARDSPNDKFIYIDIESVEGGTGVIKTTKEILGKDAPSRARKVIHQNDVMMSTVRPYLKAFALVPKAYDNQICSTGFAVLSCKNDILPHYLLYTLFSKTVIGQCNKMMIGGQYPALNQSHVAKIEIPLPPLPEQRAIASVLGTVDSAIQKVNEAIAGTERLKRGLMQRLLTRGIGHNGKFKDSEIGKIPEKWEILELKRVGMVRTGKTPPTPKGEYWNGEIPFVTPAELGNSKYTNRTERCVTREGAELVGIIPKNSVLVVCIGSTIGKVGINGVDSITNQQINSIIPNNNFDYNYVYYSLANKCELIKNYSGVAAVPIINKSTFEKIKIAIPQYEEQKKIAEVLSTVDRKLELEQARKRKLERLKKGLMADLLTGRKRVKPA